MVCTPDSSLNGRPCAEQREQDREARPVVMAQNTHQCRDDPEKQRILLVLAHSDGTDPRSQQLFQLHLAPPACSVLHWPPSSPERLIAPPGPVIRESGQVYQTLHHLFHCVYVLNQPPYQDDLRLLRVRFCAARLLDSVVQGCP